MAFRLARVLNVRTQLRRLRQLEAVRLEADCSALAAERDAVRGERERAAREFSERASCGAIDGATIALARTYEASLSAQERALQTGLAETQRRLDGKRAQIGDERREERKLEHLADRHRRRLESEAAKAAERLLDELVARRQARERREDEREHGG